MTTSESLHVEELGKEDLMTAPAPPRWFSPLKLLLIFCFVNLFVYLDRGLIASNGVNGSPPSETNPAGSGIQGDFKLTYFQDGLLPAAFLVGLLISSPVFAEVCKQYSAFRLLGMGMGVWCLATAACGLAPNFGCLLTARAFVGVGEASFVALAAPFIDDTAPAAAKATWFAAFYLCIPVGFALGYIAGGSIAPAAGWRAAFFVEAAAVVPFVLFALMAPPLHLAGTHDKLGPVKGGSRKGAGPSSAAVDGASAHALHKVHATGWAAWKGHLLTFGHDVRRILSQRVWLLACGAYTLYVAVLGVYAYWGPQAGRALFFGDDPKGQQADLVFGGVTVLTGVFGSVGGGVLLDRAAKSSLRGAAMICGAACLTGLVVLIPAFAAAQSYPAFMSAFALGQLLIFLLQAPVVAVQMWCVPTSLRALGASLMTVSIHLLGDVPSPPLLGALQTALSKGKTPEEAAQQWRVSMSLITLLLVPAGGLFLLAARAAVPGTDFRQHVPHAHADRTPLLDGQGEEGGREGDEGDEDEEQEEGGAEVVGAGSGQVAV